MPQGQVAHKDRLFNFLFGAEENRDWTLSLYNAVNGSSHSNPSDIEITTIREILYLGMHNDVSFLLAGEMSLYEQQSTYNPNMPLRMLQYLGNLYEKYIRQRRLNKYGKTLIELPTPRFVVFYNGIEDVADESILRLSDSFPNGAKSDVEVIVRMLNINLGHNKQLLLACKPLREYAWLVNEVRGNMSVGGKDFDLGIAIDRAIAAVPADFEIKPFLEAHKAEVRGMLLTEYDEADAMELFREEGMREGRREGMFVTLANLVRKGLISAREAAEQANMPEEEFLRRAAALPDATDGA